MKRLQKLQWILMVAFGYISSAQCGQLVTDELDVLGEASFYGNVNIGWNDAGGSLSNGLALYYDFNTNSGGSVLDISGNNYTGTVTGATWTNAGFSGGSYYFDGNDYISVGDNFDLTGSLSNMTVCLWFKLTSVTGDVHFISKSQTAPPYTGWEIAKSTSHQPFSRIIGNYNATPKEMVESFSSATLSTGIWYFVSATFRAESNYLETVFFLDGVLQRRSTKIGSYISLNNATHLTIGARASGAMWWVPGFIDEVRIYNRILADNEITGMYATFLGYEGRLNVKDLIVDNKLIQTGSGTNVLMGTTGIGVTNPVGQLHVGGIINVDGNIRLNDNWLSGDGDNEGVSVGSDGTVTILRLEKQGDIEMGIYTSHP